MRTPAKAVISFLCLFLSASSATALENIIINPPLSATDARYEYPRTLLRAILDKTADTWGEVELTESIPMSRSRTLASLIKGEIIHVMAEAPKPDWEANLMAIRFPIRKGLQGMRLFLIRAEDQPKFSQVTTLEELTAYPSGSGMQWSTKRVMEDAGFEVVTSPSYESLFLMLDMGRFDTFGRGVNEIFSEYEQRKDPLSDLAIEQSLAIYLPLPTYFYVSPKHPELARRIEAGLTMMQTDGSFNELFCQAHKDLLKQIRLEERRVFCIPNTNLTNDILPKDPGSMLFGFCTEGQLDMEQNPLSDTCSGF